jgi:hypothetical protein
MGFKIVAILYKMLNGPNGLKDIRTCLDFYLYSLSIPINRRNTKKKHRKRCSILPLTACLVGGSYMKRMGIGRI